MPQLLRSLARLTQTPLQLPFGHVLPGLPPTPFVFEPPPGPSPLPFAQLYATRKTPIIPKKPIDKRMTNVLSTRAARMQLELYNLGRKYRPGRPVSVFCCRFAVRARRATAATAFAISATILQQNSES
jgi:hypothetical protein